MNTKSVTFSFGTVKNATLKVPTGDYSIIHLADLVHESLLEYFFRPESNSLISNEVVVSSIGTSNFLAGALGGYETRLDAKSFALLKDRVENPIALAVAVARHRDPDLTRTESYLVASRNEALSENDRSTLKIFANLP